MSNATAESIRQFVTDSSLSLPPISEKVYVGDLPPDYVAGNPDPRNRDFDPVQLAAEKSAYANIVTQFNAAGLTRHRPFVLGRLGLINLFGPEQAATIIGGLTVVAAENPVVAELLAWMAHDAPGVDVGNIHADGLLSALVSLGVVSQEQKDTLDGLRTEPVVASLDDAWNALHTWTESRP